ncbi:MAG: glycoside hydrolase family 25 protein [Bacteroidetes bacterium]|nr:glycoside hydrolase family 25 protein [Bacteroidota bacterium]
MTKKNLKRKFLFFTIGMILSIFIFFNYLEISRIAIRTFYYIENKFGVNTTDQSKNLKHFGIPIPPEYSVHGIDVSKYQERINWENVKKMRVDSICISFAFIKATEGKTIIDRYFSINWENARKNHIIRGAYHFYRPDINSKMQADNFISNVVLEKGDLPPVLDVETIATDYPIDNTVKGIKNWLTIIEKNYHIKPIIYTNIDFYNNYLAEQGFEEYPLWIAHYYEKKLKINQSWYFWQHSDSGKVNGIKGLVDFNIFNGNMTDLKTMCKN